MRFRTIISDPPWQYDIWNTETSSNAPEKHYGTMSLDAMKSIAVSEIAHENSTLLMWCTWPMVKTGIILMEAWDFEYVSGVPWIKTCKDGSPRIGTGRHFRGCSEMILIGKRGSGSMRSDVKTPVGLLQTVRGAHSVKPDEQYDLAARYEGPYLEMFARRPREGWQSVGNEIDGLDIRVAIDNLRDQPSLFGLEDI